MRGSHLRTVSVSLLASELVPVLPLQPELLTVSPLAFELVPVLPLAPEPPPTAVEKTSWGEVKIQTGQR